MLLFKLSWRNIWRNKKRSIITISSIGIAVFLAIFMRSMQIGMYSQMIENVVESYAGFAQVHTKGFWAEQTIDNSMLLDKKLVDKMHGLESVNNIIPRLQSFALASTGDVTKGVLIQGIETEKEQYLLDWKQRIIEGSLFSNEDEDIIVAEGVASYFKVGVGDTLVFIGSGYHGMSAAGKYRICGIIDLKNPKINAISTFMPLPLAQSFLSTPDRVTHLIIDKEKGTDLLDLTHALNTNLDTTQFEVMDWKEMIPELEQTIKADSVGGLLMVFILYMIITFGMFGTTLMMTQERIFELGVMISIGMKKAKMMWILIQESLMLTTVGILIGILLVTPFRYYFNANPIELPGDQAEAIEKFGFEPTIPLSIDFDIPFTHGAIIFVISIIITLYPIIVIWKLNPVKAMKR